MRSLNTVMSSLEMALHPNTSDDEAMAAVRAFRRMAGGTTVSEFCLDWYGLRDDGKGRRAIEKKNKQIEKLRDKLEAAQRRIESYKERERLEDAESRIEEFHQKLDEKIMETADRPVLKSSRVVPMLCTEVVRARFGDSTWDNPGWNALRRDIILKLIRDGVPIAKINESVSTVCRGRMPDNYGYIPDQDISLKTRNATEICNELYNLARSLRIPLDIEFRWQNKGARANGKAGGRHAEGAALPGAIGRITWDNPPEE